MRRSASHDEALPPQQCTETLPYGSIRNTHIHTHRDTDKDTVPDNTHTAAAKRARRRRQTVIPPAATLSTRAFKGVSPVYCTAVYDMALMHALGPCFLGATVPALQGLLSKGGGALSWRW